MPLFRSTWSRALGLGMTGVLLAAIVAGMLGYVDGSNQARMLNDVTTDTVDPPRFDAVLPLRPAGSHPIEYGGAAVSALQKELYPDIRPFESNLESTEAFERALTTARGMGWEIVASDASSGRIEAIATTRIFRFRDDIVIRVRRTEAGSRVDVRSKSRVGRSDLGKNAARIRTFLERFQS